MITVFVLLAGALVLSPFMVALLGGSQTTMILISVIGALMLFGWSAFMVWVMSR